MKFSTGQVKAEIRLEPFFECNHSYVCPLYDERSDEVGRPITSVRPPPIVNLFVFYCHQSRRHRTDPVGGPPRLDSARDTLCIPASFALQPFAPRVAYLRIIVVNNNYESHAVVRNAFNLRMRVVCVYIFIHSAKWVRYGGRRRSYGK